MNEIPSDSIAKLQADIKQRDKLIEEQNSRIEHLENEVEKVRKERDRLSTKVTLLSYKLHLNKSSHVNRILRYVLYV